MWKMLDTVQILLLNNLVYLKKKGFFPIAEDYYDKNIEYLLNRIDLTTFKKEDYRKSLVTLEDWGNILQAIGADQQLMRLKIVALSDRVDSEEKTGMLFMDEGTREAVVVFGSTQKDEWADNFQGGGPTDQTDGASTLRQEEALDWFYGLPLNPDHGVTVTGFSKGGNKAKYVTLMVECVNRCLSFNSQGFSEEFIIRYRERILRNQYKIENHNVDKDYVNLLLNDVGKSFFYRGQDIGERGFAENHAPNTFLKFINKRAYMISGIRDPKMMFLDWMINGYLRRLEPEEKRRILGLMGDVAEIFF